MSRLAHPPTREKRIEAIAAAITRKGAQRLDLNGDLAGAVTDDEAAHARETLARYRSVQLCPLRVSSRTAATSRRTIMRNPSCLIS